jgi:hypothetical protein
MKVERSGALIFAADHLTVTGWTFDCEGGPRPTDRDIIRTALLHIAQESGVDLSLAQADPVPTFEVERITRNAITNARTPRRRNLLARVLARFARP